MQDQMSEAVVQANMEAADRFQQDIGLNQPLDEAAADDLVLSELRKVTDAL